MRTATATDMALDSNDATPVGERDKFVSDGVWTGLVEATVALMMLAAGVLVARSLGPTGRGEYALLILVPMTFKELGGFGLPVGIVHNVVRDVAGRSHRAANILCVALVVGMALAGLAWAVFRFGGPIFAGFEHARGVILVMLVVTVPLMLFNILTQSFVLGLDDLVRRNVLRMVETGTYLAGLAMFLVLMHGGLAGAIAGWCAGILATSMVAAKFLIPEALGEGRIAPDWSRCKKDARFGLEAYGTQLGFFLLLKLDHYVVAYFCEPSALGFYAVASGLVLMLGIIPHAVEQVVLPKITEAYNRIPPGESMTPVISRLSLLFTVSVAVVMVFGASLLIRSLYGAEFLPAAVVLTVLMPGAAFFAGLYGALGAAFQARGVPRWTSIGATGAVLLDLVLCMVLVPQFGILGAAVAKCLTYLGFGAYIVYQFVRLEPRVRVRDLLVPTRKDVVAMGWVLRRVVT